VYQLVIARGTHDGSSWQLCGSLLENNDFLITTKKHHNQNLKWLMHNCR
jgi:hypothetical protein